jgi:ketosteroid isomerase-like protein
MSRYTLSFILALACAAPAAGQTTKAATDQAFEAVYARFTEGYKRADPQMVAGLYTKDAFYLQPGGKIERGHDYVLNVFSFLNTFKSRPTGGPAIGFRIVDRQVSGDLGWDIGYYVMNNEGRAITAEDQPVGKFIVLWKRGTDGQWKIFADGYSDVKPPQPVASAERAAAEKAVVRAVNAYFDGIMNNDSVQLDIAFHPDAELSASLPNGRIYRAPYSEWRKFTTRPKGDPAGKVNRIARVDIMGNAAVATTVLDWPTVRYVDYLSLIKTGTDEWKIVSKIWHQEAKTPPSN